MKIAIAGAGIGGMTLALMLHKRGIAVELWESVDEIRALGVGINLLPHAVRELTELGLQEQLAEIGIKTSTLSYFNQYGQQIWSEPRGLAAGDSWPQFSIHRGALQMVLLRAVNDRIGSERIHLGHPIESFSQDDHGVTLHLRRRRDGQRVEARAD